jgi:hypothetical protein
MLDRHPLGVEMKRLVMKLCVGLTVLLALLRSPAADPMSKDRLRPAGSCP